MEIDLTIAGKIQGWSHAPGQTVFISTSTELREWRDYPFEYPVPSFPADLGNDIYFSPLAFTESRRSNETAAGFGCLFADLDPVDPRTLDIEPTIAWETSPGNYQAVWRLRYPPSGWRPTYREWADLNQRMTYHTGADKGGWMGSKVLRVPGTWNFKRFDPETGAPRGRLLWDKSEHLEYTFSHLAQALPLYVGHRLEDQREGVPVVLTDEQWRNMVRVWWPNLPGLVQSLLLQPTVRDRSMTIRKALIALIEGGFDAHDAFLVVAGAPWNKFADRPYTLWQEALKAADRVEYRTGR